MGFCTSIKTGGMQFNFNWDKLSVSAGLTWRNFCSRLYPGAIGELEAIDFLKALVRHIDQPLLILGSQGRRSGPGTSFHICSKTSRRCFSERMMPPCPGKGSALHSIPTQTVTKIRVRIRQPQYDSSRDSRNNRVETYGRVSTCKSDRLMIEVYASVSHLLVCCSKVKACPSRYFSLDQERRGAGAATATSSRPPLGEGE